MNADAPSDNIQIDFGRVLIQPSLAIGDRIALRSYNVPAGPVFATCYYSGTTYSRFDRPMTQLSGFDHVYQTDVPGVGFRIYSHRDGQLFYPHPKRITIIPLPTYTNQKRLLKSN